MKRTHRKLNRRHLGLMGLVIILTTYSLIMPGVSINKDTAEEEPGIVLNDSDSENNIIQESNTEENKEDVQTDQCH